MNLKLNWAQQIFFCLDPISPNFFWAGYLGGVGSLGSRKTYVSTYKLHVTVMNLAISFFFGGVGGYISTKNIIIPFIYTTFIFLIYIYQSLRLSNLNRILYLILPILWRFEKLIHPYMDMFINKETIIFPSFLPLRSVSALRSICSISKLSLTMSTLF